MTEKPTLKTIAKISGFAVPTVSRALGNAPDISESTKLRVRQIADEIGYIPNRAGVRLRTGRTNVISLVLSTDHDVMNLTARLISSVAGGLRDTPYHLVVTPEFPGDDLLKPIKYIVETGSADAIIINRIRPHDPRIKYMMERNFPFATHGRSVWSDKHSYYDYDNGIFAENAVRTLAAKGRKNLLLVAPPTDQSYALEMIGGAKRAAEDCNVGLSIAETVTSDSHRDLITDAIAQAQKTDDAYDGIISGSANATMAAIAGLESVGLKVMEDVDLFSKETVPFLSMFRPGILTEHEDIARAGEFLAHAAVQAAREPQAAPMQVIEVAKRKEC
ncbi:LacI family transcriptional regulator [Shimia sp.]|uniref:LacI family transcriptional regulator n=1 Tax=Shimia sp. TaxID=1954381 RepID=UPI0032994384